MANLKDIRERIASVSNTKKITQAMKMVSAAKLRRAQDNILNLRPYAQELLSTIADIVLTERVRHILLKKPVSKKNTLFVVITSDRGLCGSFNASVNKFAHSYYKEHINMGKKVDLLVIGKKSLNYFESRKIPVKKSILNIAKDISMDVASDISSEIIDCYSKGEYDLVKVVYNQFRSVISQELVSENILPIDVSTATFETQKEHRFSRDMIFEPGPEKLIDLLLKRHFDVQIYKYLCESVAGEHAARMTAMDSATNNANDLVQNLNLTYNKVRQAAITTEITEICSGAEALKA